MIEINFDEQFADDVENGIKTRTVRSKPYCKPGDKLSLVTGLGGPHYRQLAEAVCTAVTPVTMDVDRMNLNGKDLEQGTEDEDFARADGFAEFLEMANWFDNQYGLPFEGFVIEWRV